MNDNKTISPYRLAIDQTTDTLELRAKHFRNLIVAVTLICIGSLMSASILGSWLPLGGTFLLVPACGLYLLIDGGLLNHWRKTLLTGWINRELNFRALYDAVIAIPTLPKDSVHSMLETLPFDSDLVTEQDISISTRKAIALVVSTINACRSDAIALKTVGFTLAGGVIIIAFVSWQWQPLLGMFAIGLIILLKKWVKTRRLKGAQNRIRTARQEPDFSFEKFINIVSKIHPTPFTASEKQILFTKPSQNV